MALEDDVDGFRFHSCINGLNRLLIGLIGLIEGTLGILGTHVRRVQSRGRIPTRTRPRARGESMIRREAEKRTREGRKNMRDRIRLGRVEGAGMGMEEGMERVRW